MIHSNPIHRTNRTIAAARSLTAGAALILAVAVSLGAVSGTASAASAETSAQANVMKARQAGYDLGTRLVRPGVPVSVPVFDPIFDPQDVIDAGIEVRRHPDLDENARIGFGDLLVVLACYGAQVDPLLGNSDAIHSDLDDDGAVGLIDLLIILAYWTF